MPGLDLSGKTVLVMRALWEQVPLIKAANGYGARTVALDENEDAEGLARADEAVVVESLRDVDACLEIAREYEIDGIVTDECDYSLFTASYIGCRMSLPSANLATVQYTTNKGRLRDCFEGFVLQPEYSRCYTLTEVRESAESIGYPLVIKPVDSRGAFGVTRVLEKTGLEDAYLTALANSHAREVIVEEFIDGTPLTVEGYFRGGTHETLLIGAKNTPLGNLDSDREIRYPANLPDEEEACVIKLNDRIAATLPGGFGPTHAEYILMQDGRVQLLEFHNRGGGIHISAKIVKEIAGFDVNASLLADAFGHESDQERAPKPDLVAIVHPLELPDGEFRGLGNQDVVRDMDSVLTLQLYVEPGDVLQRITSPVDAHGLLIVVESTEERARDAINDVYQTLDPHVSPLSPDQQR